MKNVHFLPWVGSKYNIGWQGKRLMILGESHYCASLKDAVPSITHDIIADLFDADSEHEAYKNTYTKFMRSLTGHPLSNEEKREAWNRVLFYNFVQEPLTGPRTPPYSRTVLRVRYGLFRSAGNLSTGLHHSMGQKIVRQSPPLRPSTE